MRHSRVCHSRLRNHAYKLHMSCNGQWQSTTGQTWPLNDIWKITCRKTRKVFKLYKGIMTQKAIFELYTSILVQRAICLFPVDKFTHQNIIINCCTIKQISLWLKNCVQIDVYINTIKSPKDTNTKVGQITHFQLKPSYKHHESNIRSNTNEQVHLLHRSPIMTVTCLHYLTHHSVISNDNQPKAYIYIVVCLSQLRLGNQYSHASTY